ncbi:hypothetical protein LOK49_Contig68G00013 [Camellia lanceoleosa]|nr:hypothetical protein LOK49_Contig68G00013 [Camellia lanceoleosa]
MMQNLNQPNRIHHTPAEFTNHQMLHQQQLMKIQELHNHHQQTIPTAKHPSSKHPQQKDISLATPKPPAHQQRNSPNTQSNTTANTPIQKQQTLQTKAADTPQTKAPVALKQGNSV